MIRGLKFWAIPVLFLVVGLVVGTTIGKHSDAAAASNTVILDQGGHEYVLDDYTLYLFIHSSNMFEKFVEQTIVRSEAESRNLKASPEEVQKFISENMVDSDGRNRYELYKEIYDPKTIDKQIAMQVLEDKLITDMKTKIETEQKISVTEQEAKNYFLSNIDKIHKPERVEISLISCATLDKANDALKKLKAGADFNQLASDMGDIPELAKQGGYLGVMSYSDLVGINQTLADTAFKLQEGQYSDVIRGENHFHIVFLHKKYPAYTPTFDEIKSDLMEQMLESKLDGPMTAAYNKILERGYDSVAPKVKLLEPKKPDESQVPSTTNNPGPSGTSGGGASGGGANGYSRARRSTIE